MVVSFLQIKIEPLKEIDSEMRIYNYDKSPFLMFDIIYWAKTLSWLLLISVGPCRDPLSWHMVKQAVHSLSAANQFYWFQRMQRNFGFDIEVSSLWRRYILSKWIKMKEFRMIFWISCFKAK